MSRPLDPALCPLCGEPNACVRADAASAPDAACWCAPLRFDAALLARVPPEAVRRACICRRCQQAHAAVQEPR